MKIGRVTAATTEIKRKKDITTNPISINMITYLKCYSSSKGMTYQKLTQEAIDTQRVNHPSHQAKERETRTAAARRRLYITWLW